MEFKIIQSHFHNVGDNSLVKNCLQNNRDSAEEGKGGYMTQGATNGIGLTFPKGECLCAETSRSLWYTLPRPCLSLYSHTQTFSAEQHLIGVLNSNAFPFAATILGKLFIYKAN